MKKISQAQSDLIVDAVNEQLTRYPAAALEKDILLSEILMALRNRSTIAGNELQIVFGGGTSLVKGYSLLNRMSEDLDFKIVHPLLTRKELKRVDLGILRDSIEKILVALGFQVLEKFTRDSRRYFCFELGYESSMENLISLRNHILLEFTSSFIYPEKENRKIETLLYRDGALSNPYQFDFPCVTPLQTTAEKILGLLRKVEAITTGENERLMRHIYDIHQVVRNDFKPKELNEIIALAVAEDYARYPTNYPAELKNNPRKYLDQASTQLLSTPNLNQIYENFVSNLTSGSRTSLAEASQSLEMMIKNIK